jgi:phage-related minor tail protein
MITEIVQDADQRMSKSVDSLVEQFKKIHHLPLKNRKQLNS